MEQSTLDIIALINKLICLDIKRYIYKFIPPKFLVWSTKEHYQSQHHHIEHFLQERKLFDSYVRMVIRKDLDFVLEMLLHPSTRVINWKKPFTYKKIKYANYFHFIDCLSFENHATKCRTLLFDNVYRKKHKKVYSSISWIN